MHKVWCLINVKTFLRVYSDIVTLLAQKKGKSVNLLLEELINIKVTLFLILELFR